MGSRKNSSSIRWTYLFAGLMVLAAVFWGCQAYAQTATPLPDTSGLSRTCLPAEIRDLVLRGGTRRQIETCELACLQRPAGFDQDELARFQRRHGIQWCRECIPLTSFLPISAIERIEKEGRTTVCPRPVRPDREETTPGLMAPGLRGARALFGNGKPAPSHGNLAIVVSVTRGAGPATAKAAARRDAETMAVLLLERLGYRHANVFELRDVRPQDLDRVLGNGGSKKGLIAERLAAAPGAHLLVYVSGAGAAGDGAQNDAYLLQPGQLEAGGKRADGDAGYALDLFYQRLAELKAASATVVLEVAFRREKTSEINILNAPETDILTLPGPQRRGLVVMTSAEKDQTPLEDYETGLSLFTRYFVEGLSGEADKAPAGNGDGKIDTTEAFAFAAARTMILSRRVYGQLQRPMLSGAKAVVIAGAKGR